MKKINFVNRLSIMAVVVILMTYTIDDLFYYETTCQFLWVVGFATVGQLGSYVIKFFKGFKIEKK